MYEYSYSQIRDPDGRDDLVRTAVDCTIKKFHVELLQTEVTKPHVVVTLGFEESLQVGSDLVTGCRVSVEFEGSGSDGNGGYCRLAFILYLGASRSAMQSFEFQVRENKWLQRWLEVIDELAGFFSFVPVGNDMDGCRDFIAQCMVRWNKAGLVKWYACKENISGKPVSLGFHEIVANTFFTGVNGQLQIYHLPINCGTFRRGVERVKKHEGKKLPYSE